VDQKIGLLQVVVVVGNVVKSCKKNLWYLFSEFVGI